MAAPVFADDARERIKIAPETAQLDKNIDWSKAKLIAVQHEGRYKTLEAFARENMVTLTKEEQFSGLSPLASQCEWLFNRQAYADTPLVYIKDLGVRMHLAARLSETQRARVVQTGYMTPREFDDPGVRRRMSEMNSINHMRPAMNRLGGALTVLWKPDEAVQIVPRPDGDAHAPWFAPVDLLGYLAQVMPLVRSEQGLSREAILEKAGFPIRGAAGLQALEILVLWDDVRTGWTQRDAKKVQAGLDRLADLLPKLAAPGVYPSEHKLKAEARYYAMNKFVGGWIIYMLGILAGIMALVTRWRAPWIISLALLAAGMVWHAYGIGLRWYILGRIPNANMFEALTFAAWVAIATALVLELIYKTRVFLVAANATGFFCLILAGFVVPGGGTLSTIKGILDDLMLRIHTVCIIVSYALIFLAAVVALFYLFGYYYSKYPLRSAETGLMTALGGALLMLALPWTYEAVLQSSQINLSGVVRKAWVAPAFGGAAIGTLIGMLWLKLLPRNWRALGGAFSVIVICICVALAFGPPGFGKTLAWVMLLGGGTWAGLNGLGLFLQQRNKEIGGVPAFWAKAAPALAAAGGGSGDSGGAAMPLELPSPLSERPVLAGGAPGDDNPGNPLPLWLQNIDWSHLILLNMMFILLFVGVMLGAVWADYSWGRPWGWDPKEVFALNTWIVYAILIHVRFFVKEKGLWTAWLSVIGCLVMAFNWCVVNFYLVGLHSYA